MALPDPVPGRVIRYSYLCGESTAKAARKARKIALAPLSRRSARKAARSASMVLPITHSEPPTGDVAVEIPAVIKARLGLDEYRSWIVVSEYNESSGPARI